MRVSQLMEVLSKYDGYTTVLVDGYKVGFCDLHEEAITEVTYSRNLDPESYADECKADAEGRFQGLLLSKKVRP